MSLVGVAFNENGEAIGLGDVAPELFKYLSSGYLGGFNSCQRSLAAGISEKDIARMEAEYNRLLKSGRL